MKINLNTKQVLKQSINLKLWNPILNSNLMQLNSFIESFIKDNPCVEYQNNEFLDDYYSMDNLDSVSLIGDLIEQLESSSLFPTPISQQIAYDILDDINEEGYFDGDIQVIAQKNNTSVENVEKIRKRFLYLEPIGVGSLDLKENLSFQMDELDFEDDLKEEFKSVLEEFNIDSLINSSKKIESILKILTFPPALKYLNNDVSIIADFIITIDNDKLILNYNDTFSPTLYIDYSLKEKSKKMNQKIQEAKNLVELLSLRKKTLHKIVLCIIEKQSEFFYKKDELNPLTMQEIADELGLSQPTISRAVSNIYVEFENINYSLKSFFTNSCGKIEVSQQTIKKVMQELIIVEDKQKPLSDEELKEKINEKLSINLSRRVINKYRQALNILSSYDRKKLYSL